MGALFVDLIPPALGLAVTPAVIVTCVLFLSSRRPVANALWFAVPFAVVYTVLAVIVLTVAQAGSEPLIDTRTKHWVGLSVGLLLLAIAGLTYLRGRNTGSAEEPQWVKRIDSATTRTAIVVGVAEAVVNPNVAILISGLVTVAAAELSLASQYAGAEFLVIASLVGILVPVLWYAIKQESASGRLARVRELLARHQRALNIGVLLVFGLAFTVKHAVGLAQ